MTKNSTDCRIITFGSFDVLHIGHVSILERAKQLGTFLVVGVSSDDLNFSKKGRYPIYDETQRVKIIKALRIVDDVFIEESLEQKREYLLRYSADIFVMGDDWTGKFDEFDDICSVVYLERTPSISTTEIIEVIRNMSD